MKNVRPDWPNGIGLLLIHVCSFSIFFPFFFSWHAVIVAACVAYATGAWGITLCYHRVLTHRSVRLVKPVEYLTAIFGLLAMQGDPISWVAIHRRHHAYADHPGDPHSIQRGFTWAHVYWLFKANPDVPKNSTEVKKYCPDLWDDRFYQALYRLNFPIQIAFAGMLLAIGGWPFVAWAIFGRLVFAYHSTWLVNSATHMFGYRTYKTTDRSANSWWVALISYGEGWHNNHHAFPYSARHGLAWYEFDITWWTIKFLWLVRLADRVRIPTEEMRRRLRFKPPAFQL